MSESKPLAARAPRPVLIYGATASGKSALALTLARRLSQECGAPALIANADALQVYDGWRLLTARPGPEDLSSADHVLYGHVPATEPAYSAGRWLREMEEILQSARAERRPLIVVGGTGLYFKVLTEGLAPIPEIQPETRSRIDREITERGLDAAAERLRSQDPASAAVVDLRNPRRVVRALAVLEETGRGMADWAKRTPPPLLPLQQIVAARLVLDRAALRGRIADRLCEMAAQGALDEVAAMTARVEAGELDWSLPSMKALGAAAFAAHLRGDATLDEAVSLAALETGRYAKRQDTWSRNQFGSWTRFDWGAAPQKSREPTADHLAKAALFP